MGRGWMVKGASIRDGRLPAAKVFAANPKTDVE